MNSHGIGFQQFNRTRICRQIFPRQLIVLTKSIIFFNTQAVLIIVSLFQQFARIFIERQISPRNFMRICLQQFNRSGVLRQYSPIYFIKILGQQFNSFRVRITGQLRPINLFINIKSHIMLPVFLQFNPIPQQLNNPRIFIITHSINPYSI